MHLKHQDAAPSVRIRVKPPTHERDPRPMVMSLGCHVEGACLPFPDTDDVRSNIQGAVHRFLRRVPPADPILLSRLAMFVRRFVVEHFAPLAQDTDLSLETWLASTTYNEVRKNQLRRTYVDLMQRGIGSIDLTNKSHCKPEFYTEYKNPRMINSRSDEFKVIFGPICKAMESVVYGLQLNGHCAFIKHVPVAERARHIIECLYSPNARYIETDHTAFEAHFTPDVMNACELPLYEHLMSLLPQSRALTALVRRALSGKNKCVFRGFTTTCNGVRMSGDMCTSLGNGFTNLMMVLFACAEHGSHCDGFVEGDDGVFAVSGVIPGKDYYERLGMELKMEIREDLGTTTFCGIVCDTTVRDNLISPAENLCKFGWTFSAMKLQPKHHRGLLRAKAMSLLFEAPSCPIVKSLALYGLRVTSDCEIIRDARNSWWEDQVLATLSNPRARELALAPIDPKSRIVVERVFGISIDAQIAVEHYLDSKSDISPLSHPIITDLMSAAWKDYFLRCSRLFQI